MVSGTRPVIKAGWLEPRRQIGLPDARSSPLIITCGAGFGSVYCRMGGAEKIIASNDPDASISKSRTALIAMCEIITNWNMCQRRVAHV